MVDASIETIQPKLKAHILIHDVVGGLGVLEIPGKYVLLLTADETRLCKSFNGSRNFTEILSDASSSGDVMSVRSLLSLVTRLVNAGALETEEEISTLLGLNSDAPFDPRMHRLKSSGGALSGLLRGFASSAGLHIPVKWLVAATLLMAVAAITPWTGDKFSLKASVESLQFHFDELSRSGQALDLGATPSAALGALLVGYLLAIVVGLIFRIGSPLRMRGIR